MRSYPSKVSLNSNKTGTLSKDRDKENVKMAWIDAVAIQGSLNIVSYYRDEEETRNHFTQGLKGSMTHQHLDFRLPALRTGRQMISTVSSHPVCGTSLWLLSQMNTYLLSTAWQH